jgi:hypothetical protein
MKTLAAILIILAWPLWASSAQVTMSASTAAATIGEAIELRVVVRTEEAVEGIRIDMANGAFDIISRKPSQVLRVAGVATFEEIITIAFFQTGDFSIGPFTIEFLPQRENTKNEQTGQLAIRVRSLLNENDKDIKPLKELLAIRGNPSHLLHYAAAFLLLLLLGVLALFVAKKLRKKRLTEAGPPLPPEIELEILVRELRQKELPQLGEFRPFFISLSAMIKHFLQRAYGFNAKDCTTVETMALLKKNERDEEIVAQMDAIFTQADLVKFARLVPESEAVGGIFPKIALVIKKHKKRREVALAEAHDQTGR